MSFFGIQPFNVASPSLLGVASLSLATTAWDEISTVFDHDIFARGACFKRISPKGWTTFEYYTDVVRPADPLNPFRCVPYVG